MRKAFFPVIDCWKSVNREFFQSTCYWINQSTRDLQWVLSLPNIQSPEDTAM